MVNWSDAEICRKTIRNRKVLQAVWMKSAIALSLIAEICRGIHFQGPSNTTVPEGARATLYCQTSVSKTVWWKYFKQDVFYAYAISYGYKSSHEAEMNVSRGIYNLIIRNASSHAGLYTCVDNDGEGESRSAWLTVAPEETDPGNNTLYTVLIAVGTAIFAIGLIVTLLAICCKRRNNCCQEDQPRPKPPATAVTVDEVDPLMNPSKGSGQDTGAAVNPDQQRATATVGESHHLNPPSEDESSLQPTQKEPEGGGRENHISPTGYSYTRQFWVDLGNTPSTRTQIKEIEPSTTSTCVPSNSQTASSVSSPQKGKDSSPKLHEGGIPQQGDIVDTEERDVTEQLVTEGDDKEEISFENEQHVGQMGGEAG